MKAGAENTRKQIVTAADELFYRQGYQHTSFADIAAAVGLSRGNFYYHFKSKDEILAAVIDARVANTEAMLGHWEEEGDTAADRIRGFIEMWLANRAEIMRHGCPVGTLCAELTKLEHSSQEEAAALFTVFREWLEAQFVQLGREEDAATLATDLLVRSQGVAVLANAFHDEALIRREVARMNSWLDDCTVNADQKVP